MARATKKKTSRKRPGKKTTKRRGLKKGTVLGPRKSQKERDAAIARVKGGEDIEDVASDIGVAASSIERWMREQKGGTATEKRPARSQKAGADFLLAEDRKRLEALQEQFEEYGEEPPSLNELVHYALEQADMNKILSDYLRNRLAILNKKIEELDRA
jgi:hypothetical protein